MDDDRLKNLDYLQRESTTFGKTWKNLGIECWKQPIDDLSLPDEYREKPGMLFLAGREYAGILAENSGDGWVARYPHKPNYPP